MTVQKDLYEIDFYQWILKTTTLLKNKRFSELDLENLIEEIEAIGRSEKREVMNRLTTIIEHLLKLIYWESEKNYNSRGWKQTVITQRTKLDRVLKDSPSLMNYLKENWLECYEKAVNNFEQISGITVSKNTIFNLENILDETYYGENL